MFRHSETDFLLTAARPNLGWFSDLRGRLRVAIEDVSDDYGILAVQGPRSRAVLAGWRPRRTTLPYFGHDPAKIGRRRSRCPAPATPATSASRSTVAADDALDVLDAILEAGAAARHPAVRRGGADDAAHRGRAAADRRRVAQQPARVHRPRPGHARPSSAWAGCCAASPTTTAPFVGRRGDPPRARRRHLALGHRRHRRRLGSTGTGCTATPACSRPRTSTRCPTSRCCTTAPPPRAAPRSATPPASCTPPCCSGTSASPGSAPTSRRRAPRCTWSSRSTTRTRRCAPAPRAAPVQPREEDGEAMTDLDRLDARERTTRSSSAAATTAWSTPATSPRRGCAPWCSSSATSSAARRSPRSCVPGFSFTTFSYALSLLRPEIIHELDLVKHGFMPLMMPSSFHPTGDGDYLLLGDDHGAEHPGDPPALAARRRRLRPLPPRPRPGRARRCSRCSTTPRRTSSARTPRTRPTSRGCSTTSAASSRR